MNALVLGGHAALGFYFWRQSRRIETDFANDLPSTNPYIHVIEQLYKCAPALILPPSLPPPLEETNCQFIDSPESLASAAASLRSATRLALDIEHHSIHTYFGQTCLIQLSTCTEEFLIDAIALRQHIPEALGPILSNPDILKVVHGGGNDVIWLLRDFGIRLINVFDTEKCCQSLGYSQSSRGLKFLLEKCANVSIDKSLQLADWRQRPLPQHLLEYARADVHYLLYVADCLAQEMLVADGLLSDTTTENEQSVLDDLNGHVDPQSTLGRAIHRSQMLSLSEYAPVLPRVAASSAAAALVKTHIAGLRSEIIGPVVPFSAEETQFIEQLATRVHALCVWRDSKARDVDDGVTCVLPDAVLLQLAQLKSSDGTIINASDIEDCLNEAGQEYSDACKFPKIALEAAQVLADELNAAAAGKRPWAHPDVYAALKPAPSHSQAAKKKHEDPAAYKEKLGERFGAKKIVYDNCRMLSSTGELLCYTDKKRLIWYIKKGLAEEVEPGAEPLTVRLKFAHRDDDQKMVGASEFYSTARTNHCVACGAGKHYLRYRVVPTCYRRALPERMKSHRSHDIVLLCVGCHEHAQKAAERTKREISAQYNVPLFPRVVQQNHIAAVNGRQSRGSDSGSEECSGAADQSIVNLNPIGVRKAAIALHHNNDRLPAERRLELQQTISDYVRLLEPCLADMPADAQFDPEIELPLAHLAGMSRTSRRKTIRRWLAKGMEVPKVLQEEIDLSEIDQSGSDKQGMPVDLRDGLGHAWHGQQVVEVAYAQGGEAALYDLCARFRHAFIEALNPQHLPYGWRVDHAVPRSFGDYSVFHAEDDDGENGEEEEGQQAAEPNGVAA